jgi:hypothetical protein
MNERRRKILRVSAAFLSHFFSAEPMHYRVTEGAMPRDATVVDVKFNGFMCEVDMLVESAEFDAVPDGQPWPVHSILITRTMDRLSINPGRN